MMSQWRNRVCNLYQNVGWCQKMRFSDQAYCQKSTRLLPLCSQFNKIFRLKNRKFTVLVMYRNAAPRSFTGHANSDVKTY